MNINFNNPDFDAILLEAGFKRVADGSTLFKCDGVTIDLSKGMTSVNLRKIVNCAFKAGSKDKSEKLKNLYFGEKI